MNKKTPSLKEEREILRFIKKVGRRLFLQSLLRNELLFLMVGCAITAVMQTTACLVPIPYANEISVISLIVAVFGGVLITVLRIPNQEAIAKKIDATGLKERVLTAVENIGKRERFTTLQREDALSSIRACSLKERMPTIIPKWLPAGLFAFTLISIGTFLFPTTSKEMAAERKVRMQEVKKEEDAIQKVLNDLKKNDKVSKETKEKWEKRVEEAIKEFEKAENLEGLEKAKERLEKKLEQEMASNDKEGENEELAQYKKEMNLSDITRFANALEELSKNNKELDKAKDALNELANNLTEQQREELLNQLQQAANNGEVTSGDLAKALEQTGSEEAKEMASISNGQNNQGENSSEQNGQEQNGQEQNGQGQNEQGQNEQGQNGQGQNGQGQNGQGQNGQGQNGQGQNGQGQNGQGNGSSGTGWNKGGKVGVERQIDGMEKTEQIAIPNRELGDDDNLKGKTSGNNSKRTKGDSPYAWEGNRVDYNQVLGEYSKKAYSKIEGNKVPSEMSNVVKSYFDALND